MGHATIKATKEIPVRFCARKGCPFYGQEAQQGLCYEDHGEIADFKALDKEEKEIVRELKQAKKREKKRYVEWLEAHYVSAMLNWTMTLDELIRLRRDNALLRLKKRK